MVMRRGGGIDSWVEAGTEPCPVLRIQCKGDWYD